LRYPPNTVFHRVFNGNNFGRGLVQFFQQRRKGRGFSGTRWAGNQLKPGRKRHDAGKLLPVPR
jgi:hypothetical protein